MSNRAYKKGYRVEREILQIFEENGFQVVRSAGSHSNIDIFISNKKVNLGIQIKARKKHSVYSLFENADALVIKGDRKEPIICIPLKTFLEMI